jgi:hypothetical protein
MLLWEIFAGEYSADLSLQGIALFWGLIEGSAWFVDSALAFLFISCHFL